MERWREDFHQKGKKYRHQQDVLPWCITDTKGSFLMSCSIKVTIHGPNN